MVERVTKTALVDRKLDDLGVQSIVGEHKIVSAVELSAVKCAGNGDIAVLAFIGFNPTRTVVRNRELVSVYLCDLKHAQCTARLLVDRNVFSSVIIASLQGNLTPEGLLLLIVKPSVTVDEKNGGTLTLTIEAQNQLAVVGRSQYFSRCGAVKKGVGENGEAVHCKIPIDSSKCAHCTYHKTTVQTSESVTAVGNKRPLVNTTAQPIAKRLQVNNYVTAPVSNDRDASLTEQDDEDVAFSLRKHSTAVQSILGAAYTLDNRTSSSGSGILKKADPLELRVAQKIINNMATATQNNSSTLGGTTTAGSATALPYQSTAKLLARPASALTQRVEKQTLARSGNQSIIQNYGRPTTAPSSIASSSNTKPVSTASGAYKLVGDTLVNSANLLRNVANIKAPVSASSNTAPNNAMQNGRLNQSQSSFQQLLSGVVPSSVGNAYAPRSLNTNNNAAVHSNGTSASTHGNTGSGHSAAYCGSANAASNAASAAQSAKSRLDAEIDALLGKSSSHAGEADQDWAEGFGQRMDVLAKREYAQTKAAEVHSIGKTCFVVMRVVCGSATPRIAASRWCSNCYDVVHNVHVGRYFDTVKY